jgi:C2 domain
MGWDISGQSPYINYSNDNTQIFTFDVMNPDVAVLTMQVYDEDQVFDEFIGFAAHPVTCLRSGLRTVGLCDRNGVREREFGFATLFVRVSIEPLGDCDTPTRALPTPRSSVFHFKA